MSLSNTLVCKLIADNVREDYFRLRQIKQSSKNASTAHTVYFVENIKKQLSHLKTVEEKEYVKKALGKSNWSTLSTYIEEYTTEESALLA